MKTEHRSSSGIEIREASEGSPFIATLTGYAAKFGSESSPIFNEARKRPFVEKIAPGAFSETLAETRSNNNEILSFWAHDESQPLGRRGKNLTLTEDETGLRYELNVPDTTTGRDLVANVRAGVVEGVSFGFRAIKESVQRGAEFDTRTLAKVKLFEVSPTAIPAYASTSIDFRSHDKLCEASAETRSIDLDAGEPVAAVKAEPILEPFTQTGARAARFGLR